MTLLAVEKLTMRFGGITAVNGVDLAVEPGQVFSVIGPNGAGKTTLFNAVTGIYPLTAGRVTFAGHDLRRPFSWKVAVAAVSGGLAVAALAYAAVVGVQPLWLASVTRQFAATDDRFDAGRFLTAASDYIRGRPGIERNIVTGQWAVRSLDGKTVIGTAPTEDDARKLATDALDGPLEGVELRVAPPKYVVNGQTFDEREKADQFIRLAAAARLDRDRMRFDATLAVTLGFLVGALGALAVWSRSRRTPDVVALGGVARTFQNIRLFQAMTVGENVLVGMDRSFRATWLAMAFGLPGYRRAEAEASAKAQEWLEFVGLGGKRRELARNLAYGDQRRLEIARALATEPRLLLLDEPAAGMNPSESAGLMELIRKIRDRGVTVLLIEHHMNIVMGVSDRVAVLDYGAKIAEGPPAEVSRDPKVIAAYLGQEEAG